MQGVQRFRLALAAVALLLPSVAFAFIALI
jgi:hypothetical protein